MTNQNYCCYLKTHDSRMNNKKHGRKFIEAFDIALKRGDFNEVERD